MLPIEQSLLYVQPMYLRAEGGRIPELKRVVQAAGNRVVMEESIDGALDRLFGASEIQLRRWSAHRPWPRPGRMPRLPG